MMREFYDDLFLYQTIKKVTHFDDDKILIIFKQISMQGSWTIADIETAAAQLR